MRGSCGEKLKRRSLFCSAISKDFAGKCRNITVVPTTVRTARKRKKDPVKYPEVANVLHCFPQNNEKIQYVPGMSEQERHRRWIAACRLESLNVTRHTRICAKHFEGGLEHTKANRVPTIFDFPENLQRKEVKPRQDPEGRRLKNASTTSKIQKASKRGNSKVRKCPDFVEQQEVHLENNEICTGEETVNKDLLLVTRELNLSESLIGDQQNCSKNLSQ